MQCHLAAVHLSFLFSDLTEILDVSERSGSLRMRVKSTERLARRAGLYIYILLFVSWLEKWFGWAIRAVFLRLIFAFRFADFCW